MMKKFTLFSLVLLASSITVAQTETYVSETSGENNPVVYVDQTFMLAPCSIIGLGNAWENGTSCTHNLGRIVANDIVVLDGMVFTLEQISANMFMGIQGTGVNAAFVDIFVWGDAGGAPDPGNLITSEFGFIPTSQSIAGGGFGFDVWELVLDIPDVPLVGQTGSNTTYWIGLSVEATDASNVFWENSTAGVVGAGEAYDDGAGGGFIVDDTLEGVYTFEGDCTPILGVGDNLADLVNIYPNPATTRINIEVPSNIEITDVALYDVLGKNSGATLEHGAIDLSILSKGVYFLYMKSTEGTATARIIKR